MFFNKSLEKQSNTNDYPYLMGLISTLTFLVFSFCLQLLSMLRTKSFLLYFPAIFIHSFVMRIKRISLILVFISLSIYPRPIEVILERKVLQNFEDDYKIEKIITKGNQAEIPEVMITHLITSPFLESNNALLIRFTEESRFQSVEYLFEKPIPLQGYTTRLEFHLYASSPGGEVFAFLEDTFSQNNKVLVSRIQFSGWKQIDVNLGKFIQNDHILRENRQPKLLGLLVIPPRDSSGGKEFLLGIDDIISFSLPKYKLIP